MTLASTQRRNEHFEVPFDNNKNYVERPSITKQLERLFSISESTGSFKAQRVVLHGLGGSGKTEAAVRFAERHRQDYSAVFWVHGADEARLHDGFEAIGKVVFDGQIVPSADYANEAKIWFTKHSGWLLIIDNANDESALDELRRNYLKGGMIGHVLVTSRNPTASAHWNGVEIADMEQSEAVELLSKITSHDCRQERRILTDLLADLRHLPLAIDQASSYIAATEISLKTYYEGFQVEKARLLQQLPSTLYNYDSRETVMMTWEISFKRVEQVNMPASRLLLMMSIFSHDDIPIDMLELNDDSLRHWASNGEFEPLPQNEEWVSTTMRETLQSRLRLREALLALKRFSFIRYKPGGKSFGLHPLVHYWASQRLESHPTPLTMCSIGLVASSFGKEERMPPFAVPYGSRDGGLTEDKTLRLWPWRQYKKLAPHAHHCMPYIIQLDTLPESMAHLSLSLLQVFEYPSTLDEPDKTYRVDSDYAHDIIDHVATFSEDSDGFLNLSIVLWRLTRAVVCTCQKTDTHLERYCRCREASSCAAQLLGDSETLQDSLPTARVRAASLGLSLILYLGGARLQTQVLDESIDQDFVPDKAPFNTWFNPETMQSRMEQYVYNFSRYLEIGVSSEYNRGSINHEMAEEVTRNYERLCGRNSEEYRRSVWFLTTSLGDRQDWSQVQDYMEPLVRYSIKYPVNSWSWSHERCIIRLVKALIQMGKKDEAQQIMVRVQKAYMDAGKMLRSTRRMSSLTPCTMTRYVQALDHFSIIHTLDEIASRRDPSPSEYKRGTVANFCQNPHRKNHNHSQPSSRNGTLSPLRYY